MRVIISYLHIFLVNICLYSHLIPLSYLSVFDSFVDSAPLLSLNFFLILHILYSYVVDIMIAETTTSAATALSAPLATELINVAVATHQQIAFIAHQEAISCRLGQKVALHPQRKDVADKKVLI